MNRYIKENSFVVRHWWISVAIGALYIVLAVWLLLNLPEDYKYLSILFSFCMILSGTFEIIFAVSNKNNAPCWIWYRAGGVLDFIVGLLLINVPIFCLSVMPYFWVSWLLLRGTSGIAYMLELRHYGIQDWGWDFALSLFIIVSSIGILWLPEISTLSFIFVTASIFMFVGTLRIVLSMKLKSSLWGINEHSELLER